MSNSKPPSEVWVDIDVVDGIADAVYHEPTTVDAWHQQHRYILASEAAGSRQFLADECNRLTGENATLRKQAAEAYVKGLEKAAALFDGDEDEHAEYVRDTIRAEAKRIAQ